MTLFEPAVALQQNIEDVGALVGAEKYVADQERKGEREGFDRRNDVQKLIRGAIPLVAAAIRRWVSDASAKAGRPPAALGPLKTLDADLCAYLALSKTFHNIAKGTMLSGTAIAIGKGLQVEIEARMIQEADPKAAKRFLAMAEGEAKESITRRRHEALLDRLQLGLGWSTRTQALVGGALLNLLLTALPEVFERATLRDSRGTVPVVLLTEAAKEQLASMTEAAAWLHPVLQPMVVPPRPWTHYDTGAYLDYRLSKTVPLLRTFNREHQSMVRQAIKDGSMAEQLEGLNAIQGTRFAIDQRVLDVLTWCRENGLRPSKSFPLSTLPELPRKTPKEEWQELAPAARAVLSRRRKAVRDIRGTAAVDGGLFVSDTAVAGLLAGEEAFYLPHSMDFRGRVYAVPHFNPQRSDHVKGLFHFADAVPLGGDGGRWLMIHLANCGDFGKVSKGTLDERVQWVRDNEADVLMAARYPQETYDYWSEADSPFCFLQACFEYDAWMQSGFSPDFPSTIGIAQDGSCSGLQHYSAMTRSAEEGYHVNLVPRDRPGDIYQVVADRARPDLEAFAVSGDPACRIILEQGFGRGEVKRNVMTYFYGSGKFGMRDQHMEDLIRPLQDRVELGELAENPYAQWVDKTDKETGVVTQRLDGGFGCAVTLAAHVYAAVTSVAPKADEAASWFQSVAAILAHEGKPVVWRTPTGLPVMQRYNEYTSKKVSMWLYDRKVMVPTGMDKVDGEGNVLSRVECIIREAPTKRIDKKKARSAISPNVVHSLDAAHLVRTVVMASREGIRHFQLIHDSFATHAGNMTKFSRIIREAFVSIYDAFCPFEAIDTYARSVLSDEGQDKLPPIPAKGTLELTDILRADYAFA